MINVKKKIPDESVGGPRTGHVVAFAGSLGVSGASTYRNPVPSGGSTGLTVYR